MWIRLAGGPEIAAQVPPSSPVPVTDGNEPTSFVFPQGVLERLFRKHLPHHGSGPSHGAMSVPPPVCCRTCRVCAPGAPDTRPTEERPMPRLVRLFGRLPLVRRWVGRGGEGSPVPPAAPRVLTRHAPTLAGTDLLRSFGSGQTKTFALH